MVIAETVFHSRNIAALHFSELWFVLLMGDERPPLQCEAAEAWAGVQAIQWLLCL